MTARLQTAGLHSRYDESAGNRIPAFPEQWRKTMTLYVCGHRNPDADSILAAVATAELCRRTGHEAVACRAGAVPAEAAWALKRFGFSQPALLEDARLSLREISLSSARSCRQADTIFDALQSMNDPLRPYLGVTGGDGTLQGMVTRNDLSDIGMQDTALGIRLLQTARLEDIARTLSGTVAVHPDKPMHIDGRVSIVALSDHSVSRYEVKNRIVIVADSPEAQLRLIEQGAGLLILVWTDQVSAAVRQAAMEAGCPVVISGHGSMNTSRYLYFSVQIRHVMTPDPVTFHQDIYVQDAIREMRRHRFRAYPVVDEENRLQGFLETDAALNFQERRMIRVDHNEDGQAVRNGSLARVEAVIDHHRVGGFLSREPVFYRCEILGSTCTIVARLYLEAGIPLSGPMAGLLLSGMISDTLGFRSPTTTETDRQLAQYLAFTAGVDARELEQEILSRSGSSDLVQVLETDLKQFDIQGQDVRISQILTGALDRKDLGQLQTAMEQYVQATGTDLLVTAVTVLPLGGSCLLAAGDLASRLAEMTSSPSRVRLQEGLLSRKKQILPLVQAQLL